MTTRFDLPACSTAAAHNRSLDFGCCSRAASDAPPPVIGELALLAERTLEFLFRTARKTLREVARAVQQRPWL